MIESDSWGRVKIRTSKDGEQITVISAEHISELKQPKEISLGSNRYITTFDTDIMYLYFEDREMGSKMNVDYVTDLFNLDIYGLEIDRNAIWALDWINERQEKMLARFDFLSFCDHNRDEEFDYVLR
ncbi:hypothetical protein B9Z55_015925 [Caenorhabditis nigoni]|uniref:F-box associated domain-containing protein n=1 Tax=Caenorhabditis nigoni TaxID=1611254 RepID=A0A2G5UCH5_9PELO|nr:hypothetical protein B9Z55_015925 [Caenorhabditis nigoni]